MVRYTTKHAGIASENLIVGLVLGLAVILFLAIVMWPSGSKAGASLHSVNTTALAAELDDARTIQYLTVLQRVDPASFRQLHTDAEAAITSGADKDELAMLVLGALGDDIVDAQVVFFKSDVKYFDEALNVTKTGLTRLSNHAPKYCRTSHYEALASSNPDEMMAEFLALIGYDSVGYKFALDLNQVLLEGIEDGRKSPNRYGRLKPKDEQAVQMLVMSMMSSPVFLNAMRTQSMAPGQQKIAMRKLNMCDLANEIITGVLGLPKDTKKRVMGEMSHMAKSDDMTQSLQEMASGF